MARYALNLKCTDRQDFAAGGAKHTESPSLLAPFAVECMLLNQHASSATETKLFGEVLAPGNTTTPTAKERSCCCRFLFSVFFEALPLATVCASSHALEAEFRDCWRSRLPLRSGWHVFESLRQARRTSASDGSRAMPRAKEHKTATWFNKDTSARLARSAPDA